MKKLLIFLFLGIFLISFASATITIIPPPAPPENLTATLIPGGGTLPAGNYAFRIVHMGNESSSNRYQAQLRSPPSNEVNITIVEGQGIWLQWDSSNDPWVDKTYIYVRNTNVSTNQWYFLLANGYSPYYLEDYNFTTWTGKVSTYAPCLWMTDGNSPDPPLPFGINNTAGIGMVLINGNAGNINFASIITALKNYYGTLPDTISYDGKYRFAGAWSIKTDTATSGSLDISGWSLWLAGGYGGGTGLQLKAVYNGYQPTLIQIPFYGGSANYMYYGYSSLNNTIVSAGALGMDASYYGTMQDVASSSTRLTNSVESATYPVIYFLNTYTKCKFIVFHLIVQISNTFETMLEDYTILSGSLRYENNRGDLYISRMVSEPTAAHFYYYVYPYPQNDLFIIDSKFPNSYRGNNIPSIYFIRLGASPTNGAFVGNSFNLKLRDENNNPIENASVLVWNRNGLIINTTTNSIGQINKSMVLTMRINRTGAGNGYEDDFEYYYPYNFSITADGYTDYTLNGINVTDALDWTIALESQPVWNYSVAPYWGIRNDSTQGIFKLSPTGDLAIAGKLYENTNSPPLNIYKGWGNIVWLDVLGNLYINGTLSEVII